MKFRRLVLLTTILIVAVSIALSYINSNTSNLLISSSAADILSNDKYYLKYTTQWLLSENQVVEIEEVRNGPIFLQKYELDGKPLVTLSHDKAIKVLWGNELLQEKENTVESTLPYSNLRYNGICGIIKLDEHDLYFEEYEYKRNNEKHRLRFLFSDTKLWGFQYDKDDRYVEVITLSRNIPDNLLALIKEKT